MPALPSTLACVYMSIVNTSLMHLWSRAYDNNLYVYAHFQQKSGSCVHVHQSLVYVHVCIAFNPCMCVYVNRRHKPYASMVTCVHVTFTTQVCACPPKPNIRTCLRPLHVSLCQSSTQALCIYGHVHTCQRLCLRSFN